MSKNNFFGFPSPCRMLGFEEAPIYNLNNQKPFSYSCNEIMNTKETNEVFQSGCSSDMTPNILRRSSLMKQFDPFYFMHQNKINGGYCNSFNAGEKSEFSTEKCSVVFPTELVNKAILNGHSDDCFISLESPKKVSKPVVPKTLFSEVLKPVKKYTEEEFHRAIKDQELSLQKKFTQNLLECDTTWAEKNRALSSELSELIAVNKSYNLVLSELLTINESIKASNQNNRKKAEDLCVDSEKLKLEIKAVKEDYSIIENAFSDIYKRYETSKAMIKDYEENKKHLTQNIESRQRALDEQESMNILLTSRIQDLTDKTAKETDNSKKSADTQIMFLEAQLKKSEIKIASLENDLEQARSNKVKITNIYDDLMQSFKSE